jgi:Zn finger protein HypA/HybF involved in hydrogenase expression
MSRKYTLEEFKLAVEQSYSVAQVLTKLGLAPKGGNYGVFHRYKKQHNIDTSHFTGQGHLKGKTHNYTTKPLEEILVEESDYNSHKLRLRLIGEGIKEHKCECCRLSEWMGQPISLELDHIDGDNKNNKLDNLRVLCPNCHAQTPTYRGKNKKKIILKLKKIEKKEYE